METLNLDLINEIGVSFDNYKKDKDVSQLMYAFDCYDQVSVVKTHEESELLKEVFYSCPDEYLKIIANNFAKHVNGLDEFQVDYAFEYDFFATIEYLGENNYKQLVSFLLTNTEENQDNEKVNLFLDVLRAERFDDRETMYTCVITILEKYDSWLACRILGDLYFGDNNFENAIIFFEKGNKYMKEEIERNSENFNNATQELNKSIFESVIVDLEISYSSNIIGIIEGYYQSNNILNCLSLCNKILSDKSSITFGAYEFECHFYKAFCLFQQKQFKYALTEINKALSIDSNDKQAIKLKMFLLEHLKKYDDKIVFINGFAHSNIEVYLKYVSQIDRLEKRKESTFELNEHEEEIFKPTVEPQISKRLLSNISHSGNEFTSEKLMEAFMVSYIDRGMQLFGRLFKIFADKNKGLYGRQFRVKNGFIDLLLVDTQSNHLFVVELKKDKGYNNPYEQIKNYQQYIETKVAEVGQKVFGILCLSDCSQEFKNQIKGDISIEVFTYDLVFTKL